MGVLRGTTKWGSAYLGVGEFPVSRDIKRTPNPTNRSFRTPSKRNATTSRVFAALLVVVIPAGCDSGAEPPAPMIPTRTEFMPLAVGNWWAYDTGDTLRVTGRDGDAFVIVGPHAFTAGADTAWYQYTDAGLSVRAGSRTLTYRYPPAGTYLQGTFGRWRYSTTGAGYVYVTDQIDTWENGRVERQDEATFTPGTGLTRHRWGNSLFSGQSRLVDHHAE